MRALIVGALAAALAGCGSDNPEPPSDAGPSALAVTSPAFADGGRIPDGFTCHGPAPCR